MAIDTESIAVVSAAARLLSLAEASERLALSIWTLRSWAYAGKIGSCKLGSRLLIPESEVQRLIDESLRPVKQKLTIKPVENKKQKDIGTTIKRLDRQIASAYEHIAQLEERRIRRETAHANAIARHRTAIEQLLAEKAALQAEINQ